MIYLFGYGIQGRAHALNLRDSGADVTIINRNDEFSMRADQDAYRVLNELDQTKDLHGHIL